MTLLNIASTLLVLVSIGTFLYAVHVWLTTNDY
jgi:hypothetical protein